MSTTSVLERLQARDPAAVSLVFPKDRYRLHAMVTSTGYDRRAGTGYDWHGLKRGDAPFVLLQHTIAGQGRLRYENRQFVLRPGQTMLLSFPHDNRYWLPREHAWEFFWICLNGREILRMWQELKSAGPVVELPERSTAGLAEHCLALLDGAVTTPARASGIAYAIAMQLADDLLSWGAVRTASKRPAAIERAVSLCHANPAESLDVDRLARASGYSRYHFSRLFEQHEGTSPARFVLRLRMEQASRLLRLEEGSVKLVAQRCGFSDANYFTKVFRRFFGITPRDFRRSGMFNGAPSIVPQTGLTSQD